MTDLRSRLHAVVDVPGPAGDAGVDRGATALDDVLVGSLTARVRRRRAVRSGATGALGALTVAAVAAGAVALTDGRGTTSVPAGTEQPVDDATGMTLECGDVVPEETLDPVDQGMTLAALELANPTVVEGEPVDVAVRIVNDGTGTFDWDTAQVLQLAALRDGAVVATATMPLMRGAYSPGSEYRTDAPVTLSPCEPTGHLPAGEYELDAAVVFADADGTEPVGLSIGPVPFTVVAAPDDAERAAEAEAALAEVVAAASARADAAVGACGTRIPDVTDPYLGLGIELNPAATGEALYGDAALTVRDGLTVVGDAPLVGVRVVLTVEGVVVGRGAYDDDARTRLRVRADEPLELPAIGDAVLCRLPGDEGPTLPLPAGTYQAYGLYQVAVTEVEQVDGSSVDVAALVTGTRTVVSAPVDVVVDDPLG